MRKKYLSALLFGALLFASAGTFTSCKDYDEDINNLQTQITDVKNAVAELQKLIGDGKFVTNVVAENNGLKITWNDGQSTIIENVINGEAQKGDVVTFDSETGEIKINDEGTGYYVSKDPITNKFKTPYVNEDGILVLIDEEGKEVVTGIRTAPVTAVANSDGSTTIVLWVDGEKQEVIVPSAASSVTDVDIIGYASNADEINANEFGNVENGFYSAKKGYVTAYVYKIATATSNWKGNKPNLKAGEILASYKMNGLVARVAPLSVDASELNFDLVNSKSEKAPLSISMTPYSNNTAITRTASKNGMYSVNFEYEKVSSSKTTVDWFIDNFGTTAASKLFALSTETGLISTFDIAVRLNQGTQKIDTYFLNNAENQLDVTSATSAATSQEIEVGKTYTVSTNDDSFIYDAFLTFDDNDIDKWGIQYDKANAPLSFTVTKLPDNLSTKEFSFKLNYLTKNGTIQTPREIFVTPKTNLDAAVQLCSEVSHRIVKNDNYFTVSLDEMFKSLGDSKKLQWIRDVNLNSVAFEIKEGNTSVLNNGKADASVTFTEDADGKKATTDASKAQYVKFTFANNANHLTPETSYVATITFAPKIGSQGEYAGNVINKVTVPLKITIPAFTDLLQKDMNVFDEKGEVASAYLLEEYDDNNGISTTTYKFNGAFEHLADNTAKGFTFTLTLDNNNNNKIVDNQTTQGVACLATDAYSANMDVQTSINVDNTNANLVAISLRDTYKYEAYGKELIVKLTNAYYCSVYKYDDTSFKIKLLSPIKEGKFVANGGAISIAATGITNVTAEDVWATTVNENVKYDLFKTAIKQDDGTYKGDDWYRQDVANVAFSSDRIKFIVENKDGKPTDAVVDETTGAIKEASSISLRSVGNKGDRDKLKITVTDIWGYTLEDEVDVVVE